MTVIQNIPQYYSYKNIYSTFLVGRRVHECLTHRFSNNTMFIGNTDDMTRLYLEMTKLWVLLETLSELFNDNPIFSCNQVMTDDAYLPRIVDTDVEEKYIGYFNKLYSCLKTTLDSIKSCKRITEQFVIEDCASRYSMGTGVLDPDCVIGDYNEDYYKDYFNAICNNISIDKNLIICNNLYVITNNPGPYLIELDTVVGLAVGDTVEAGRALGETNESIVVEIIDITGNVITIDSTIPRAYTRLMIVQSFDFNIIDTLTIDSTDFANECYRVVGNIEGTIPVGTSVIITDDDDIKYYDVIVSVTYDPKTTPDTTKIRTNLIGVLVANLKTFEVTDHIVSSSYCR